MTTTTATAPAVTERIGVPLWVVAEAKARIATLAARVAKKGLTGFHAEVAATNPRPEIVKGADEIERPTGVTLVDMTIAFSAPVLEGGWTLSGVLDFESVPGSVLLQTVPGATIPEGFRSTEITDCDHCHAARRRNKIIVVRSEDGRYARVGSTCVKDFLGVSPETLIAFYGDVEAAISEIDEWGGSGRRGAETWSTRYVLALSLAVVKLTGWVSRAAAGFDRSSTADLVSEILHARSAADEKRLGDLIEARDGVADFTATADEIIAWATTEWTGGNEWGANLRAALAADEVTTKAVGLVASATAAWYTHQERLAQIEAERTEVPDAWIGEVGKREAFIGKVLTVRWFDGDFGARALVRIATEGGLIKTWNSGAFAEGIEVGDVVRFKATIKSHEVYNDRKETAVSRAAIELTADEKKAAKVAAAEARKAAEAATAERLIIRNRQVVQGVVKASTLDDTAKAALIERLDRLTAAEITAAAETILSFPCGQRDEALAATGLLEGVRA